jgi:hypothetical protein
MPETLQQLLEQVQQLDPAMQALVIQKFQQVLDEALADARWDELLRDQRGLDALRRLGLEALAEHRRGETTEGGFGG